MNITSLYTGSIGIFEGLIVARINKLLIVSHSGGKERKDTIRYLKILKDTIRYLKIR
jgi:hypothetical protein